MLVVQVGAQVARDCAPVWPGSGPAGQEQEWVATRMAEMGPGGGIQPASAPSLTLSTHIWDVVSREKLLLLIVLTGVCHAGKSNACVLM